MGFFPNLLQCPMAPSWHWELLFICKYLTYILMLAFKLLFNHSVDLEIQINFTKTCWLVGSFSIYEQPKWERIVASTQVGFRVSIRIRVWIRVRFVLRLFIYREGPTCSRPCSWEHVVEEPKFTSYLHACWDYVHTVPFSLAFYIVLRPQGIRK